MPNPYFNNQRTFIPNTLVKSDEVNSQFNDVENGFDLIDELVQEVQDDVNALTNQTTTNTTQITQIINGEIPVGGGGGGGGESGGVGGNDPLGESQFPIGTFAYRDQSSPIPTNHLIVPDGGLALDPVQYSELAANIAPVNGFQQDLISDTLILEDIDGVNGEFSDSWYYDGFYIKPTDSNQGKVLYFFTLENGQFNLFQKLTLIGPTEQLDYRELDINNGVMAVTIRPLSPSALRFLRIYKLISGSWQQTSQFEIPLVQGETLAFNSNGGYGFGVAVLNNGTIAVGDVFAEVNFVDVDSVTRVSRGAVYIYTDTGVFINRVRSPSRHLSNWANWNIGIGLFIRPWGLSGFVTADRRPYDPLMVGGLNAKILGELYAYQTSIQPLPTRVFDLRELGFFGSYNNQGRGALDSNTFDTQGDLVYIANPDEQVNGLTGVGRIKIFNLNTGAEVQDILSPDLNSNQFGERIQVNGEVIAVKSGFSLDNWAYRVDNLGVYNLELAQPRLTDETTFDDYIVFGDTDVFLNPSDEDGLRVRYFRKLENEIALSPLPSSPRKVTIVRVR